MKSKPEKIINIIKQSLKENFNDFKGAYLYGSYAKNTDNIDSDIDIVAIFENQDREKRRLIWQIIGKIEAENDVFIDLHPMTIEELNRNPIYYNEVVNKGIYYDAA